MDVSRHLLQGEVALVPLSSTAKISMIFGLLTLTGCMNSNGGFKPVTVNSTEPVSQGVVTPSPAPAPTPTPAPPTARPSSAANKKVCAGSQSVAGTDVSNYDVDTQWSTFQKSGGEFAYIKATEGISVGDSQFIADWAGTKALGILRGAYHFYHPKDDPVAQATFFLKTVGTINLNDLPPLFDWEVTDGKTNAVQIANAKVWLQLVEAATGQIPMIYVSPAFWNALGNPQGFERYPLFIAEYGTACPSIPPPWSTWTFWQKNVGPVTGVATRGDIDEFNGSLTELDAFSAAP